VAGAVRPDAPLAREVPVSQFRSATMVDVLYIDSVYAFLSSVSTAKTGLRVIRPSTAT
jgi:hypothetical protein